MVEENNKINEPEARYGATSPQKKITFFKSFEEAEEHGLKEMASHTHAERLKNLSILRRRTYHYLLLPDGSLPPADKKITIIKASYK